MLSCHQDSDKREEIVTNEISVQVEEGCGNYSPSKGKPNRYFTTRKFEFFPEIPAQNTKPAQLSTDTKLNRKRVSALGGLISSVLPEKDSNCEANIKVGIHTHSKKPKRCKSGELRMIKEPGSRFKLCEIHLKHSSSKSDVVYSEVRIRKHPSAYQIPPVFDPMDNFITMNIPLQPCKHQSKPRVFKNYQYSQQERININKKAACVSLPSQRSQKRRYYFRHLPNSLSVNLK